MYLYHLGNILIVIKNWKYFFSLYFIRIILEKTSFYDFMQLKSNYQIHNSVSSRFFIPMLLEHSRFIVQKPAFEVNKM